MSLQAPISSVMSVRPSTHLHVSAQLPTGQISVNFYMRHFHKNLSKKSKYLKIGKKNSGHFM